LSKEELKLLDPEVKPLFLYDKWLEMNGATGAQMFKGRMKNLRTKFGLDLLA
jgi:hypothetical protein